MDAPARSCDLRLVLGPGGHVNSAYSPATGLRQKLTLTGHVDDPDPGGGADYAPHFDGKPVYLSIVAPPRPGWLENVRAEQTVALACGTAEIYAGVMPEKFSSEWGDREVQPVQISLAVTLEALSGILAHLAGNNGHPIGIQVALIGKQLPARDFLTLAHLDVSKRRWYAVGAFELGSAVALPPPPTPEKRRDARL